MNERSTERFSLQTAFPPGFLVKVVVSIGRQWLQVHIHKCCITSKMFSSVKESDSQVMKQSLVFTLDPRDAGARAVGLHDPNANIYQRVCFICKETSKEDYMMQYGALSCLSCRAFFRRAHQSSRNSAFVCKKTGLCLVTPKTRRRCQKCRYDLCLLAGMRPEAVLTEEQRKTRFRKMIQRRSQVKKEEMESQEDKVPDIRLTTTNSMTMEDEKLQKQLGQVQNSYDMALSVSMDEIRHDFFDKLSAFHTYSMEPTLTRHDILAYITNMTQMFKNFAGLHKTFSTFVEADQKLLLATNTPLYIQYRLGRYFTATTGQSQLEWLLGNYLRPNLLPEQPLHHVPIEEFNCYVGLFPGGIKRYKTLVEKLDLLTYEITLEEDALISYLFLFHCNESMTLSDPHKLSLHKNACLLMSSLVPALNLQELTGVLTDMSVFFAYNFQWQSQESFGNVGKKGDAFKNLVIPFTNEEELWLNKQCVEFVDTVRSVSLGADLINEFVMFTFDVPLSRGFFSSGMAAFMERSRRIFNSNPDIHNLGLCLNDVLELWNCNRYNTQTMFTLQNQACSTGLQQLQVVMGEFDEHLWQTQYVPLLKTTNLKKITMTNTVNTSSISMDKNTLEKYENSLNDVLYLAKDSSLYKLTFLVLLSTPPVEWLEQQTPARKRLSQLHSKYLMLLKRRCQCQLDLAVDMNDKQVYVDETNYKNYMTALDNIKYISQVHQHLVS